MPEVLGMRHSCHFTPSPSHKFYCLVNLRCLNLRHVITFNSETVSGVPRTPLIYPSSHSPCVLASVVLSILSIYVLLLSQVSEVAQSCPTLKPARLLCPWDSPGKSTGVGCHFLLQEIFPIQGLNPGLLHCRQTLYCLSH